MCRTYNLLTSEKFGLAHLPKKGPVAEPVIFYRVRVWKPRRETGIYFYIPMCVRGRNAHGLLILSVDDDGVRVFLSRPLRVKATVLRDGIVCFITHRFIRHTGCV